MKFSIQNHLGGNQESKSLEKKGKVVIIKGTGTYIEKSVRYVDFFPL